MVSDEPELASGAVESQLSSLLDSLLLDSLLLDSLLLDPLVLDSLVADESESAVDAVAATVK